MQPRILVAVGLLAGGCGGSSLTMPDDSSMVIAAVNPPSPAMVVLPSDYPYIVPGGVVIPRNSGHVSVSLSMRSAHEVPWARLSVYLLTGGERSEFCGENSPDSPTWSFLPSGWTASYTVTGFRVYRLPCEVTGIRAMLHMRNNGLVAPPISSETIAEATIPVSYQIRSARPGS